MTGYESKRAAARDKLLDDDDTQVYQNLFPDAKNMVAQPPIQYSFKAYWAKDGRIGVVGCIIRPDGGPHIVEEFIDPPQSAPPQLLAHIKFLEDELLTVIADGYYSPYTTPPQPAQEPVAWCSQCGHKCPLPAQEPVAHLCKPDQHGLFDPPTPDKACKDCFPVYTTPPQRPWVGLMRGARVEGETVVIKVQSNNDARLLCSELVNEMEKNT
jgi:hypothetical protein